MRPETWSPFIRLTWLLSYLNWILVRLSSQSLRLWMHQMAEAWRMNLMHVLRRWKKRKSVIGKLSKYGNWDYWAEPKWLSDMFKQDLEQARAYLRSRVIYSPLEAILEKAQRNYFEALGTPVRKKYGPVFVWESQLVAVCSRFDTPACRLRSTCRQEFTVRINGF